MKHSLTNANAHTQSIPALHRGGQPVQQGLIAAMLIVAVALVACLVGVIVFATLA